MDFWPLKPISRRFVMRQKGIKQRLLAGREKMFSQQGWGFMDL